MKTDSMVESGVVEFSRSANGLLDNAEIRAELWEKEELIDVILRGTRPRTRPKVKKKIIHYTYAFIIFLRRIKSSASIAVLP